MVHCINPWDADLIKFWLKGKKGGGGEPITGYLSSSVMLPTQANMGRCFAKLLQRTKLAEAHWRSQKVCSQYLTVLQFFKVDKILELITNLQCSKIDWAAQMLFSFYQIPKKYLFTHCIWQPCSCCSASSIGNSLVGEHFALVMGRAELAAVVKGCSKFWQTSAFN